MNLENLSVLVVEDNLLFAKIFFAVLKPLGIGNIKLAPDAAEGAKMLVSENPDIVFMDNRMPGMFGSEAVKLFKKIAPETSVILMSGRFSLEDAALCAQNGADYLIDKSKVDTEAIRQIFASLIESKKKKTNIWRLLGFAIQEDSNTRKNIAVVEDDKIFGFYINWYLNEQPGHHLIHVFTDAESFYAFYQGKKKPDIVFIDFQLPGQSGGQILETIKKEYPKAKTVMISAQEEPEVVIKLTNKGLDNYIIKDENWKKKLADMLPQLGF